MKDFKFKLTDIRADGALVSATVTDSNNHKFEITVGQCDGRIKRNTGNRWDNTLYQAAGMIRKLHYREMLSGKKMPTNLVIDKKELRRWQTHDVHI